MAQLYEFKIHLNQRTSKILLYLKICNIFKAISYQDIALYNEKDEKVEPIQIYMLSVHKKITPPFEKCDNRK